MVSPGLSMLTLSFGTKQVKLEEQPEDIIINDTNNKNFSAYQVTATAVGTLFSQTNLRVSTVITPCVHVKLRCSEAGL